MKTSIGKAAKELGVSRDTLRRWEKSGKIIVERAVKGHRRSAQSQRMSKNQLIRNFMSSLVQRKSNAFSIPSEISPNSSKHV